MHIDDEQIVHAQAYGTRTMTHLSKLEEADVNFITNKPFERRMLLDEVKAVAAEKVAESSKPKAKQVSNVF